MTIHNVTEAKTHLSALLTLAENGEEVFISRSGKPIVKLVPIDSKAGKRPLGLFRGKLEIPDDFDAPCPEIEKLFGMDGS